MGKKTKFKKASVQRIISEPLPITECVDFQRMFSFPLTTNSCSVKDINNNFGQTMEFLKFLPRKKSMPVDLLIQRLDKMDCEVTIPREDVNKFPDDKLLQREYLNDEILQRPVLEKHLNVHKKTQSLNRSLSNCMEKFQRDKSQTLGTTCEDKLFSSLPEKPPRRTAWKKFTCQNNKCRKTEMMLGKVEMEFKSCEYCFTHYCSVNCQQQTFKSHLEICYYAKIYYYLNLVETLLYENDAVNRIYYEYTLTGYKSRGRGCLFLVFLSPSQLFEFVDNAIYPKPSYSTNVEILKTTTTSAYQRNILQVISAYHPTETFLINIAILVDRDIPIDPLPRRREQCLKKLLVVPICKDPLTMNCGIIFDDHRSTLKSSSNIKKCRRKSF